MSEKIDTTQERKGTRRKFLKYGITAAVAGAVGAGSSLFALQPRMGQLQAGVLDLQAELSAARAHARIPPAETLAPIPDSARGPAIDPSKGYFVQEIRNGVYWVTDSIYQAMFLTTGKGVIVVDAPPSIGKNMLKAIADVTNEPITHVVYSHSHADHISAAGMYPTDATYIAHVETAARLAGSSPTFGLFVGGSKVPLPTVTFSESYTLSVGSQTLELSYKGPAHEAGNIFMYAPQQKVLMLVDVIFPGWTPFKNLAVAEHAPDFIRAHDDVLSFDFDTFIGGHLGRLGTRQDVEIQREYVQDMVTNAAEALKTIDFGAIVQKTGFEDPWLTFATYLDAVTQKATDLTVLKWKGRLAAVDVFTYDHLSNLVESLRID